MKRFLLLMAVGFLGLNSELQSSDRSFKAPTTKTSYVDDAKKQANQAVDVYEGVVKGVVKKQQGMMVIPDWSKQETAYRHRKQQAEEGAKQAVDAYAGVVKKVVTKQQDAMVIPKWIKPKKFQDQSSRQQEERKKESERRRDQEDLLPKTQKFVQQATPIIQRASFFIERSIQDLYPGYGNDNQQFCIDVGNFFAKNKRTIRLLSQDQKILLNQEKVDAYMNACKPEKKEQFKEYHEKFLALSKDLDTLLNFQKEQKQAAEEWKK